MINIAWHELISWALVIISSTLFIVEKRSNSQTKNFMMLQGLLQACRKKVMLYAHLQGEIQSHGPENIPKREYALLVKTLYSDHESLMQNIMGCMRAIEPKKGESFNVDEFLNRSSYIPTTENVSNHEQQ
ncbi:hypothetical protein [Desulforhopalus singaporensis]|nr:hypothetical protein [Desulforhopalus singaporensis]